MAGLGAAINTGNVGRGDSVAVIGCGGVGAARSPAPRWPAPRRSSPSTPTTGSSSGRRVFGATHTVNARTTTPVEAIQALTGGNGADVVIEAVGRPET